MWIVVSELIPAMFPLAVTLLALRSIGTWLGNFPERGEAPGAAGNFAADSVAGHFPSE